MLEPGEVHVAVERQAVRCDVPRGVDSDGTDLAVVHPNAGVGGRLCFDSKLPA